MYLAAITHFFFSVLGYKKKFEPTKIILPFIIIAPIISSKPKDFRTLSFLSDSAWLPLFWQYF